MKALNERDPFKLGLVAFAVGALLIAAVIVVSVVPMGEKSYTAVLEQTAGLRSGEDVDIAGVQSGTVKSVKLDGDRVKVKFTLNSDVKLGAGTSAEVKVATLLGTHYLQVVPKGTGSLANDTIPLERTTVPFNLQDVIEKSTESLNEIDAGTLAQALKVFNENLSVTKDDFAPALTGIARLSEMVASRNDQLADLMTATQKITNQLSDSSDDLVGLMEQSNLVIAEITKRRQAIHDMLEATTTLSNRIQKLIVDTKADLAPAFVKVNQVIDTLRQQDATMKDLLTKLQVGGRYLANATGSGPWTNIYVNPPGIPGDDGR